MRVFLTGGTGLIGRQLIPLLMQRGATVLCLSRDPASARAVLPAGVEIVGGDPNLPGVWQDRAALCDAVVNLAGESVGSGRWTSGRRMRLRRSRLATTAHVAEAVAQASQPVVLVNASAVGYYGDARDRALGEDAQPGQDFLARLAVEWEHSALQAERDGVRVALLRIGVVLAPDGGALDRMIPLFRLGLGGPLGSGRQYFPWIHIRDLVEAILFIIDEPRIEGPVNAVVPSPPRQKEFARALGRALGKPAVLPAPAIALRLLLGRQADLLLFGQRALPNVLKTHGFRFRFPELEAALADVLGSRPDSPT
ncbi:MAG: TIGR01777 family oxidoreductase [bacterium]